MGISTSIVQAESTNNQSTGDEVVVFAQTVAVLPPDCPGYNQPLTLDYEWRPETRLGCSNAVNLGLMMNYGYASTLYKDPRGIILVGCGLISYALGIGTMAKMVRFDV